MHKHLPSFSKRFLMMIAGSILSVSSFPALAAYQETSRHVFGDQPSAKRHCMINVGTPDNPRWVRDPSCGIRR